MSKKRLTTEPLAKGSTKTLEIFGFSGLYDSMRKNGVLENCDNVHILPGGAVASLLAKRKIDITATASLAGVYTYYDYYDPSYEIPTTAEWVYANICPEDVLDYANGMDVASRLLVADVGKPPKTENGYRNVVCAFADDKKTYILYDAIYNLIDQRRVDEFEAVGDGYTVLFDSRTDEDEGMWAKVCTLTQVYLDVIDADNNVSTSLLTANLEVQKTLSYTYGLSLLISTDKENFRYVTADYQPSIGGSYTIYYDKIYTDIYPTIATAYEAPPNPPIYTKRMVRYRNRTNGTAPYGSSGEKLLLLPDMRLLVGSGSTWSLEDRSDTIPTMTAAVQHFERLFGISGDRVYASVQGDCTDYTEAEDNLPSDAGWQAVTSDAGGFTAIASFDGKVIIFTESNMLTVRGIDLPFSISTVGSFGCKNQESVAVYDNWLYFISDSGILRYNGSRVENISGALPTALRYEDAKLTVVDGLIVVYLDDFYGLHIFDPASETWSHYGGDDPVARLVGGGSSAVLLYDNHAFAPYRLFDETGEFSFSVEMCGGRRRIRSISVTARLAPLAVLHLTDASGKELMCLDEIYDKTVTRTCLVRGMYQDDGALHFSGSGGVTLYGIRVTYAPMTSATRKIRNER